MNILTFLITIFIFPSALLANGMPSDWQLSFQKPGSPLMEQLVNFHDLVFWIITVAPGRGDPS